MYTKSEEFCMFACQIEHEETLGKLYNHYSKLFPEVEIWKQLEEEEKNHAKLIHPIIRKVCDNIIHFKEEVESCEKVKRSIKRINDEIIEDHNRNIDLEYAIKTAIEIEEEMVELEFFRSLDTDAPFVEDMLRHIILETEKHRYSLIKTKNEYIKTINVKPDLNAKKSIEKKIKVKKEFVPDKEIFLNRDLGAGN